MQSSSSIINIAEILSNAEGFLSAGLSDGYNFDGINAEEYFDELIENSEYKMPIFSGILVLKKNGTQFTIIDGLQRVTTICLLLRVLCENYRGTSEKNTQACDKIFNRYLLNEDREPKLQLIDAEETIYKKILFSEILSTKEEQSQLFQAYNSFLSKIRERKITGTDFFNIISKIQFMVVLMEGTDVPTRELYQAINRKDKSQINLISDFIAQKGGDEMNSIWQNAIDEYKKKGLFEVFEDFMRDFLVIQNEGKTPNRNALYNNFKSYFSKMSRYIKPKNIVENIVKYSGYYLKLHNADFEDADIRDQVNILNVNNGKDAYPYLMEVLDDLENSHLEKEIFIELLCAINLFVKNKQEDPDFDLNIDFTSLSNELNKMLVMKDLRSDQNSENKLSINEMNKL